MASTPSASALSAVLRCQGNIWTRNPPTKRPATSAYSLGLSGGALRDFPAERNRSNQASGWEAFLRGGRVIPGGRLTRVHGKMMKGKDCADRNQSRYPCTHSHSPGAERAAVPCVQNTVRKLAHTLTPVLCTGIDECSQMLRMIKHHTYVARVCKIVFLGEMGEFRPGGLKVSITSPRLMERTGHLPSLPGWSTVRSTYLSLTALVSELVFLRLVMLWRCSSSSGSNAPPHLQRAVKKHVLQVSVVSDTHGHFHNRGQNLQCIIYNGKTFPLSGQWTNP